MLPQRALTLIREYSKPITSPKWRDGAPHAILIIQSPYMQMVTTCIKNELLRNRNNKYNKPFVTQTNQLFDSIYEYTDINYIQEYGEDLLVFISTNYQENKNYINFYYYAKQFLIDTYTLKLLKYRVYHQTYYEWVNCNYIGLNPYSSFIL